MYEFLIYSCLAVLSGLLIYIGELDKLFISNIIIINIILIVLYFKYHNYKYIQRIIKNIFIYTTVIVLTIVYANYNYDFLKEIKNTNIENQKIIEHNIKNNKLKAGDKTEKDSNEKYDNRDIFLINNVIKKDGFEQIVAYNVDGGKYMIYDFVNREILRAGDIIDVYYNNQQQNIIYPNITKGQYKSYNTQLSAKSRNYEDIIIAKRINNTNKKEINRNDFNINYFKKITININIYSEKILEYFNNNLSLLNTSSHGITAAMVWGDERLLDKTNNTKYNNAGLSHILVLSGFNIALLFGFCAVLLHRLSFRMRIIFSFIIMTFFILVVLSNPPIIRAFLMMSYLLISQYFFRQINSRFALWLSLFIFIILSPLSIVYDVSLQLSVLATLAILYLYPEMKLLLIKKEKENNKLNWLVDIIILTASINIVLTPFLLYMFGQFNLLSMILNILVTPIIPIIMIIGIIISIFGTSLYYIYPLFILLQNNLTALITYLTKFSLLLEYRSIGLWQLLMIYFILFILYKILCFFNLVTIKNDTAK